MVTLCQHDKAIKIVRNKFLDAFRLRLNILNTSALWNIFDQIIINLDQQNRVLDQQVFRLY